ncbi:hypothetical protein F5Y07DRAFT_70514 [Xylaria sp. FL0933]|nr:hypothetical protein F5Y07DRAFT_70514 [Xylaria sp. FL0933]
MLSFDSKNSPLFPVHSTTKREVMNRDGYKRHESPVVRSRSNTSSSLRAGGDQGRIEEASSASSNRHYGHAICNRANDGGDDWDDWTTDRRPLIPTSFSSTSPFTPTSSFTPRFSSTTIIVASSSHSSTATTTSRAPESSGTSNLSEAPAPTSSASDHVSGDSPTGLGTLTVVVLGSVIGAVAAVLILLTLTWLAMRKSIARRRGSTHAQSWNFWAWRKVPTRRINGEESTEYRKPELGATETGVGYNPGAPHELSVPRIGHDYPAELDAVRSPVELMG